MIPKRFSSEAVVLSRKNYSEADRIVTVYSKDYGKVTLLAKGVRKPKSRKRGSLEVFSHIKFAAAAGKGMHLVTEADTVNAYSAIRQDLKKISVAYFLLETISKLTQEEEENQRLFSLLIKTLNTLERSSKLKTIRLNFIKHALVILGFWNPETKMSDHDKVLEGVVERSMATKRVGQLLQ